MQNPAETNRAHWDQATEIHARGNVYGIEDFRAGACRLHRVEVEELGDVRGKSLLHLQCHFGLDTLSWARRGADVTGADFSPKGIAVARRLAEECSIAARFVESDLYALPENLSGQFDLVYTSYGVLNWLPDLTRWGQIIARFLKPGGTFYIVEAHPLARVFPMDADIGVNGAEFLKPCFSYYHDAAGVGWPPGVDYADATAMHSIGTHEWQHTLGEIINALASAGLRIEFVHEFPFCAWAVVAGMKQVERFSDSHGYWALPAPAPPLPMLFSLRATKAGGEPKE